MADKTVDSLFTEDQMETIEPLFDLEPRARDIIVSLWIGCLREMLPDTDAYESPIEQILAAAIVSAQDRFVARNISDDAWVEITPQVKITTSDGEFRSDMQVAFVKLSSDGTTAYASTLVECDGHDFHEKTKAQAAHDKRRDRLLAKEGHRVLHFTGSEIWRDPHKCAKEVYEQMQADLDRGAK